MAATHTVPAMSFSDADHDRLSEKEEQDKHKQHAKTTTQNFAYPPSNNFTVKPPE
jgi:hypothetical protein